MKPLRRAVPAAALACVLTWAPSAHAALIDVTTPGDAITVVNGVNDGDSFAGAPPWSEGVEQAIDNFGQKYLNYLDLGSGFIVTPTLGAGGGGTLVTGLRLYTANDSETRDPASYVLEGALTAGGPFSVISTGALALPSERNSGGLTPLGAYFQELTFSNSTAYFLYRLTFPTLKDASASNSMQIGEVELLGVEALNAVPEPMSVALLAVGLGALRARRRKP